MSKASNPPLFDAPHPGSPQMPKWDTGELPMAPRFTWRNWFAMLGPGLVLGGAAIGGGEWLLGPRVTAVYGAALLWLGTLSILGQVIYNIEISRYTLYSGEPIFTGKFRTLPGPHFWLIAYLIFDFGAVFPYLAANAATPVGTLINGGVVPNPAASDFDFWLLKLLGIGIFILAMVPLLFGGKIYNSLKLIMSFKIVVVFGFLLLVAFLYSTADTWKEILSGFVKFGTVPVERPEDLNGDGTLDEHDIDWDGDGTLDRYVEPRLPKLPDFLDNKSVWHRDRDNFLSHNVPDDIADTVRAGEWPDLDPEVDRQGHIVAWRPDFPIDTDGDGKHDAWGERLADGSLHPKPWDFADATKDGKPDKWPDIIQTPEQHRNNPEDDDEEDAVTDGRPDTFVDINRDGFRDGANVDNVFVALAEGRSLIGTMDFTLIALITGLAAIAGAGGLSNTPISNYTRDQGWGMGKHVGAIPSVIGGHNIALSHVGCVFKPDEESLPRWRKWYRHVVRDQMAVWMPACFIGLALPAMLSVQFLPRGFEADDWTSAAMTADKVQQHVDSVHGAALASIFWFMVLFCGFLVLAPSMSSSADGIIRRWVDVFWTSSGRLRQMDPSFIKKMYFRVLIGYATFGIIMLCLGEPTGLIKIATTFFNIALGFSCWHTLAANMILLPKPLRPGWFVRITLALSGLYFMLLGILALLQTTGLLQKMVG